MTATIPGYIAWPLFMFMAVTVIARYLVFNTSQYETYLNHCLALAFVASLLHEQTINNFLADHRIMSVATAEQLSLVAPIFAGAEFIGFITLWSRQSVAETVRRHWYHRLAAYICSAGLLISGSSARTAGETLEQHGGWSSVIAWTFHSCVLVVLSVQLLKMCVKEMARTDRTRRERLIAGGGIALGLTIGSTCINAVLLALFEELNWTHTVDMRLRLHAYIYFVEPLGASLLGSAPLILALYSRAGLDITTRNWKQLQNLRNSVTAAVPAIAFDIKTSNSGRRKSKLELHQTIVQIRDAILLLRPYFRTINESETARFMARHSIPDSRRASALLALQLARAIELKEAGDAPNPFDAAIIPGSRSANLEDETTELVHLSKWWPHAQSDTAATRTLQRLDQ